jgi:hypothetical protein
VQKEAALKSIWPRRRGLLENLVQTIGASVCRFQLKHELDGTFADSH